jgi:hypothetical protein
VTAEIDTHLYTADLNPAAPECRFFRLGVLLRDRNGCGHGTAQRRIGQSYPGSTPGGLRIVALELVGPKTDPKKLYGGFGLIRIPTDPTGQATARRIYRKFEAKNNDSSKNSPITRQPNRRAVTIDTHAQHRRGSLATLQCPVILDRFRSSTALLQRRLPCHCVLALGARS